MGDNSIVFGTGIIVGPAAILAVYAYDARRNKEADRAGPSKVTSSTLREAVKLLYGSDDFSIGAHR